MAKKNDQKAEYQFIERDGSFAVQNPEQFGATYFPLVNEAGLLSAITPRLHGDIKLDQHTFLTVPVGFEDIQRDRGARNVWLSFDDEKRQPWSVAGNSSWQRSLKSETEKSVLRAGFLWQELTRTNRQLGLEAIVLNFVPTSDATCEIMQVTIKNISKKALRFTVTSAIPLYGRSADNLRDHRHVTSLLNRLSKTKYGISLCPTMTFNERGHLTNKTGYYVTGLDARGQGPIGFFPTNTSFVGIGDFEKPDAIFFKQKPVQKIVSTDQGKEVMGALQFQPITLRAGQTTTYTFILGIQKDVSDVKQSPDRVTASIKGRVSDILAESKKYWAQELSKIEFYTGNAHFDQWLKWVQLQPTLRKIFGCSFLPDFDYGKGGRGWRDLWQDCLALLLSNPTEVREMILKNVAGIRIDGSNATILKRQGRDVEFLADRNNITRTWMDHGVWPFLTTKLYLDQSGDWDILLEKTSYFRDGQLRRAKKLDLDASTTNCVLRTSKGDTYQGTLLEHILLQHLVQFFNVGEHNIIKLEDADWNDGLDMAHQRGESVAFTHLYGGNLQALADLLDDADKKCGWRFVTVPKEFLYLFDRLGSAVNYDSVEFKQTRLSDYFDITERGLSGEQVDLPIQKVAQDLRDKAHWIKQHINQQEWVSVSGQAWMNGYYDNEGRRVEGRADDGRLRMTLTGQVYPLMSNTVPDEKIPSIVQAVNKNLFDKKIGGIRLNTDFGSGQPALGRAFSFSFGEKENGAVFSHMVVMYGNALYTRGFATDGFAVLNSLYTLATRTERSKIFPGLPEYFNNEAQGRYHYLTGSASWMILTMLTQVFGVRGHEGDLIVEPKLNPSQYDERGLASVALNFAGARVTVEIFNPGKASYEKMRIKQVTAQSGTLKCDFLTPRSICIPRQVIHRQKTWHIRIELEKIK